MGRLRRPIYFGVSTDTIKEATKTVRNFATCHAEGVISLSLPPQKKFLTSLIRQPAEIRSKFLYGNYSRHQPRSYHQIGW